LGLKAIKVNHALLDDGLIIEGGNKDIECMDTIDSFGDHRIAMSFLISGIRSKNGVQVKDCNNIKTSFPNFIGVMNNLGMNIHE